MVVREDDRGGVVSQRGLDDLAWINTGLGQRTAEHRIGGEQAMLAVEEQHDKRFMRQVGERETQVIADRFG